jgi:RNA polymerase sigma-70 factor, ECF subfamily
LVYTVRTVFPNRLYMDKEDKKEAFIALYDSLSSAIFRHCFFRLSSRERALEISQEAFLKVWEYFDRGDDIKNPSALVYKVANNLIIDEYRRKKTVSLEIMQETGFDVDDEQGGDKMVERMEIDSIRTAVGKLPEKYRQVVTLRFIEGLSPSEIGQIVNRTENSVSVQLNRAIKMLQEILHL